MIKSPADTREYRYFTMSNGLQVSEKKFRTGLRFHFLIECSEWFLVFLLLPGRGYIAPRGAGDRCFRCDGGPGGGVNGRLGWLLLGPRRHSRSASRSRPSTRTGRKPKLGHGVLQERQTNTHLAVSFRARSPRLTDVTDAAGGGATGLAHFLEHMLFMGSEKYPDENEYSAFLAQHGGGSVPLRPNPARAPPQRRAVHTSIRSPLGAPPGPPPPPPRTGRRALVRAWYKRGPVFLCVILRSHLHLRLARRRVASQVQRLHGVGEHKLPLRPAASLLRGGPRQVTPPRRFDQFADRLVGLTSCQLPSRFD